jgi:hypothetical protein
VIRAFSEVEILSAFSTIPLAQGTFVPGLPMLSVVIRHLGLMAVVLTVSKATEYEDGTVPPPIAFRGSAGALF